MARPSDQSGWLKRFTSNPLWTGLNPAQQDAVALPNAHALILAGAGTGKTKTLVARIAALLQDGGVAAREILAVTFTNKAAKEMTERVGKAVGDLGRGLTVGTFHGVMYRWIRHDWEGFGYKPNATILDTDDQKALMKRLYKDQNWDDSMFPIKETLGFINDQKEQGLRPRDVVIPPGKSRVPLQMYEAYQRRLVEENALDFAELLIAVRDRLRDDPAYFEATSGRWATLLVDEFQDTNPLQYDLLERLVKKGGAIFAVGDDDQSIYGFRGARVENVFDFEKHYAGPRVVRLEENYRSTGNILAAANGIIAQGAHRMGKKLWTAQQAGAPIKVRKVDSEQEEAMETVSDIAQAINAGVDPMEIAVLYRSNAQSRVLEQAFIRRHLPYKIVGGLRFFERAEVKDALAHARVLICPDDVGAFHRAVAKPAQGIGPKRIDVWRKYAEEHRIGLFEAIKHAAFPGHGKRDQIAVNWVEHIERGQGRLKTLGLAQGFAAWMDDIGLREAYAGDEKAEERLENLNEFVNAIGEFEQNGGKDLAVFIADAVLDSGEAGDAHGVQLSTVHAAKGLEFEHVFWVGLEEGLAPNGRALAEDGGEDEERRLAYVAITRAKKHLTLSFAAQRFMQGVRLESQPSRYLSEIDPALLKPVNTRWPPDPRPANWEFRPVAGKPAQRPAGATGSSVANAWVPPPASPRAGARPVSVPAPQGTGPIWAPRDKVRHPRFGIGTIVAVNGLGDLQEIKVKFNDGERRLIAKFASLTLEKS